MKRRPLWISLLTANLGVLAATLAVGHRDAAMTFRYSFVYANCLASFAGVIVPRLIQAAAAKGYNVPGVVAFSSVLSSALGGLLAQFILITLHWSQTGRFWSEYLTTFKITAVLSATFGMGAFFYGSVKEQLRQTAEGRQLAEERANKLAVEARLASLQSRLNPHFLFNALNSVTALITVNPQRAEEMLTRLSHLLRKTMDNTLLPLVPIEDELRMTEEYLAIERMRMGDKLSTAFQVAPEVRGSQIPPLSIQLLAENAVKHGINPKREGGHLQITAERNDGNLRVLVSDNGPGFDLAQLRPGHGLDTLVGRLDAMFGGRARFNVSRQDSRCVAELIIPQS